MVKNFIFVSCNIIFVFFVSNGRDSGGDVCMWINKFRMFSKCFLNRIVVYYY